MLMVAERRRLTNLIQQNLNARREVRPFPAAVTRLISACQDINATAATFEKIIECDASLAVRLLRMANSALFGLTNEVRTVRHATALLGIRRLKHLALSVAAAGMFSEGATAARERKTLWNHSLGCATVARLLAKFVSSVSPDDAFLAGIFHDVGKLLLYDVVPRDYAMLISQCPTARLREEEVFVFGVSHEEIGLRSAHSWGLAEEIKAAIGYHHRPNETPVHFDFAALVHIANSLSKEWNIGSQGAAAPQIIDEIGEHFGLTDELLVVLEKQARDMCDRTVEAWAV